MARISVITVLFCTSVFAAEPPNLDGALTRLYNFDFRGTHAVLNQAIAANPQDPLPYAFRASAYLFYELDRLGVLESEFLSADDWAYQKKKAPPPDPAIRAEFLKALQDTDRVGTAALKANPSDKRALFALCIGQGVTADYMALIDKRQFSSLSPSKKSNNYAQQLLKLDPKFYDAYMTAGFSEYMVGSLPFFIRWFVHFDGVAGSKEKGKQNLELAAREGHYFRSFAKILMALIYVREKQPVEAHKLLTDLAHDYPENALFRKELAKLNGKVGAVGN